MPPKSKVVLEEDDEEADQVRIANPIYEYRNNWYPVVHAHLLTDKEPYGIQICGYPLVFYRYKGKPVCVEDLCPHRSAPLSVGRIMDGKLECKYHGWQFGDAGECTHIPSDPERKPAKSSNCKNLHTIERNKVIWVWIGDDVSEEQREAKYPHFLFRFQGDSKWAENWGMRDLEIDHGYMIENLLDPAHLPFTHEGTLAKRKDAQKMYMETVWNTTNGKDRYDQDIDEEELQGVRKMGNCGFKVACFRPNMADPAQRKLGYFTFVAPYTVQLDLGEGKKFRMIQVQLCVPVTPRRMRLIFFFYRNVGLFARYIPGSNRLFEWYSDKIINQDVEMLDGQQSRILQGGREWNSSVPADQGGVLYRRWRHRAESPPSFPPWFLSFRPPSGGSKAAGESSPARAVAATAASFSGGNACFASLVDIEDLMAGGCSSRFTPPASSRFETRTRIPLIAPEVKRAGLMILFVLVLAIVAYFFFLSKYSTRLLSF